MAKIDLTSTAAEKGIEAIRDFVDKLITPAAQEAGLLVKDRITMWRFKNQIKMLAKAKLICEQNNIQTKTISLKLISPLLEYSAIEEDEVLQDKWAVLLTNLVDSNQNIENHVFPYILSQISRTEFDELEKIYTSQNNRVARLQKELDDFKTSRPKIEEKLKQQIEELKNVDPLNVKFGEDDWKQWSKKNALETELKGLDSKEQRFKYQMQADEIVPEANLRKFELSNLSRLGLIKEVNETYAPSQSLEIPNRHHSDRAYITIDFDIDLEAEQNYVLTELGYLFMDACTLKS